LRIRPFPGGGLPCEKIAIDPDKAGLRPLTPATGIKKAAIPKDAAKPFF
jgi:hypothetical protein